MPAILAIAYPWLKSLHVVSVILWMGAQLLLPALLAVHRGWPPSSGQAALLAGIERSLIRRVMNPAMLATFVFGALLASSVIGSASQVPRWLAAKLALVLVLAALHGKLLRQSWRAADGEPLWTACGYRSAQWLNAMLLTGVVLLVVARPLSAA